QACALQRRRPKECWKSPCQLAKDFRLNSIGATMRGGATGYFSFLAFRRPRLGRQNSGEMTEAGHTLCWRTNPDLWYAGLLFFAGVSFFFDAIFSSKNFYFRDI